LPALAVSLGVLVHNVYLDDYTGETARREKTEQTHHQGPHKMLSYPSYLKAETVWGAPAQLRGARNARTLACSHQFPEHMTAKDTSRNDAFIKTCF
jgi:hypothetical protein